MSLNKKLDRYFNDYSNFHRSAGNKVAHYFGITFIIVSLFGLLSHWTVPIEVFENYQYFQVDGGSILLVLGAIWYLFLDWKIAIPFGLFLTGLYFLGRVIPVPINWGMFVAGWILQGIGHVVYEKKSPAFFKNLTHLLIGPLWVFSKLIGYR